MMILMKPYAKLVKRIWDRLPTIFSGRCFALNITGCRRKAGNHARLENLMPCQIDEVESLGLFAAQCDFYSSDPYISAREQTTLTHRASRYRDLQMVALADPDEYKFRVAMGITEEGLS